jgi:hypothetical protein
MGADLQQPQDVRRHRTFLSRLHFLISFVFLLAALATVALGYSINAAPSAVLILVALGAMSLYCANRFFKRSRALSAPYQLVTLDQTIETPQHAIHVAYEIPAEVTQSYSNSNTRIFNAAKEALNLHASRNGSMAVDDLKAVILAATKPIAVDDLQAQVFVVRILSVDEKRRPKSQGIVIGHGRS